jgi:hypothetical protein
VPHSSDLVLFLIGVIIFLFCSGSPSLNCSIYIKSSKIQCTSCSPITIATTFTSAYIHHWCPINYKKPCGTVTFSVLKKNSQWYLLSKYV